MTNRPFKMGDRVRVLSTNGIGSVCEVLDDINVIVEYDKEYEYLAPVMRLYHTTVSDLEILTKEPKFKGKTIAVYQCKIDEYYDMPVYEEYKYIGKTDKLRFIKNHNYFRVLPKTEFRIVDETGEDYLCSSEDFELVKTYEIDKNYFLTNSNRIIHYYNEHRFDIKPIKEVKRIHNLDDLFKILLNCFCKETAYPSCQSEYDEYYDPTYGQCAITAMIVNDIFGGTIHKIKNDSGGTHYFNKINGIYFDLTSDQFTVYKIELDYEPNEEVPREYCGENPDTLKRYKLLNKRMNEYRESVKGTELSRTFK